MDIYMPPEKKIIKPHAVMGLGVRGEFKCIVRDGKTLRPVYESPWNKNIITNYGLTRWLTGSVITNCAVGSGSTAATATDDGVETLMAFFDVTAGTSDRTTTFVDPDYEITTVTGYRFNEGTLNGTVREIAIFGTTSDVNTNAVSRSVLGSPIAVSSTQIFDIFYRTTHTLSGTDTVVNGINISEDGTPIYYDTITRLLSMPTNTPNAQINFVPGTYPVLYSGALGAVTDSAPSGSSESGFGIMSYEALGDAVLSGSSAYRDWRQNWGINGTLDWRTIRLPSSTNVVWQTQYTDVATGTRLIPYNLTNEMTLDFRYTITRT